jgi:hypothetical protein
MQHAQVQKQLAIFQAEAAYAKEAVNKMRQKMKMMSKYMHVSDPIEIAEAAIGRATALQSMMDAAHALQKVYAPADPACELARRVVTDLKPQLVQLVAVHRKICRDLTDYDFETAMPEVYAMACAAGGYCIEPLAAVPGLSPSSGMASGSASGMTCSPATTPTTIPLAIGTSQRQRAGAIADAIMGGEDRDGRE